MKIFFGTLIFSLCFVTLSFSQIKSSLQTSVSSSAHYSVPAFTNRVEINYWDGYLYLKLKNEVKLTLPEYERNRQVVFPEEFKIIIEEFGVYSIHKAFPMIHSPELENTYKILFDQKEKVKELIKALQKIPSVEYVEKVPVRKLVLTPNDPMIGFQYALSKTNAFNAWNLSTGSRSVKIAIVDDEVKLTHEDLSANKWVNPGEIAGNGIDDDGNGYIDDINGYDVADHDGNPNPPVSATDDNFTHGTHCAGIADGVSNNGLGIASIGYGLSLIGVKCDPDNTSNPDLIYFPLEGVEYAIAAHADVISMSWGGGGFSQTEQSVFNAAWVQGIILVAAAGNDGVNEIFYPAQYDHILSVGSTGSTDVKSYFSNYGSWIGVMAPGEDIASTVAGSNSSYANFSGTSMATPMVAGLCGLIKSLNPILTNAQIISCLKSSCDNIDAVNPSLVGQLGAGRINAYAALLCSNPNVAPIVAFETTSGVSSCTGSVSFKDESSNNPTEWLWDFGDGGNSTLQDPIHTYGASGTYAVSLKAINAFGNNVLVRSDYIAVTLLSTPSASDVSRCEAGAVTLNASSPDGKINWYNVSSEGNILSTGNSFTTSVSASADFYAEAENTPAPVFGGMLNNSTGTGSIFSNATDRYLIFNCTSPVKLISVVVYASGGGNRTIQLRNSSGTVIQSLTVNLNDGQNTVTLNFNIPVGDNLQLGVGGTSNLYRNQSGAAYPYNVGNYISIVNNSAFLSGYYYNFYNWKIQEPGCISSRKLVKAIVIPNATASVSISSSPATVCPGTSVHFTASAVNGGSAPEYQWKVNDINTGTNSSSFSSSNLLTGDLVSCTMISNEGCVSGSPAFSVSNPVVVTPLPSSSIIAGSSTTFCLGTRVLLTNNFSGFNYQWQNKGVNISGATGISYNSSVPGSFTCLNSNECGTVTSNAITLIRKPTPAATITLLGNNPFCWGKKDTLLANTGTGLTYQWTRGNVNINGATSSLLKASVGGTYKVLVTIAATGCYKLSSGLTLKVVTCKDEEIISEERNISIYPNPFFESFILNLNNNSADRVEISDLLGRTITIYEVNEVSSFKVGQELTPGFYLMRIWKNNEVVKTFKLIKGK